jgi:hypothetical protein
MKVPKTLRHHVGTGATGTSSTPQTRGLNWVVLALLEKLNIRNGCRTCIGQLPAVQRLGDPPPLLGAATRKTGQLVPSKVKTAAYALTKAAAADFMPCHALPRSQGQCLSTWRQVRQTQRVGFS